MLMNDGTDFDQGWSMQNGPLAMSMQIGDFYHRPSGLLLREFVILKLDFSYAAKLIVISIDCIVV